MALHPQVRKQQLKLRAAKLTLQSKIGEARDQLRAVNDQLRSLKPKKKGDSLGS